MSRNTSYPYLVLVLPLLPLSRLVPSIHSTPPRPSCSVSAASCCTVKRGTTYVYPYSHRLEPQLVSTENHEKPLRVCCGCPHLRTSNISGARRRLRQQLRQSQSAPTRRVFERYCCSLQYSSRVTKTKSCQDSDEINARDRNQPISTKLSNTQKKRNGRCNTRSNCKPTSHHTTTQKV